MVFTCIGDEFNAKEMPYFPRNVIILIVAFGINFSIRCYIYYVENIEKIPPKGNEKHPSFGFGAKGVTKALASLGVAFSLPELVLWFVFRIVNMSNSLEFACQIQSGVAYLAPILLGYFCLMMYITNFMRYYTRHGFARVVMDHINPVDTTDNSISLNTTRIAVLPAYRGIWITPIVLQYLEKASKLRHYQYTSTDDGNAMPSPSTPAFELIAMDCYQSIYNPEDSTWLTTNMNIEEVPSDLLHIVWTDFKHIDLPDNSLDSIVIPIGALISYLTLTVGIPGSETKDQRYGRTVTFFLELKRVLKKRGTLIGSNLFFYHGDWVKALHEAGFVDIQVLPEKVWWSYLPATVTVGYKPLVDVERTLSTATALTAATSNPGDITQDNSYASTTRDGSDQYDDSDVVVSPVHNVNDDSDCPVDNHATNTSSFSTFEVVTIDRDVERGSSQHNINNHPNNTRSISLSATVDVYIRSFNNILCPSGTNFRLVELLVLITALFYVGFVLLTVLFMDQMQVPGMLPYDQTIAALFVNNCLYIPVATFTMVGELRTAAATTLSSGGGSGAMRGGGGRGGVVSAELVAKHDLQQRSVILSIYRNHLTNILIVVTLVTGLGWVPFASFDLLLIEVFHQPEGVVSTANIFIGLGVILVLVPIAQILYKWYVRREYLQEKEVCSLQEGTGAGTTPPATSLRTELAGQAVDVVIGV